MSTNSYAAFCCTCCHAGSSAFAILDSWPADAAARWFRCANTCSRPLRPPRRRRRLTPIHRFRHGLARFAAVLWLWSSVLPLFRSRSGLHPRLRPDMRNPSCCRSFNASTSGCYRCASLGAFLRSACVPQSYSASSLRFLTSLQLPPKPANRPHHQPSAPLLPARRFRNSQF